MKRKIPHAVISTTVLAVWAVGAPALADGLNSAPAPAAVDVPSVVDFEWTGFYVGGGIGTGSSNYELGGSYSDPPISASLDLPELGGNGMLGSVRAGYDHQINENFVVGASLDALFSDVTNDTNVNLSGDFIGGVAAETLNLDYELSPSEIYTIAVRAGYLGNDTTMLYGLVGYSRGTFEGDLNGSFSIDGSSESGSTSYNFDLNGMTVGFGMETMLSGNLSLGIEYRYTDFDRYRFYEGPLIGGDNVEVGFDTSVQSVQGLLSYRF